ncbi:PTS sugar transporter subunit IIB, partial [Bacillus sp. S1-R5C1-FB]|uniref:PTS sugar transporter subunit IIB n=1 Tax=Bacillus sp. S1-R5C1-FB TaxID=1973491 RepID=UPI002101463E
MLHKGDFQRNIVLCCSAGMSTSLLVTKMEAAAKARGLEGKMWAVSGEAVITNIEQADVLLLGLQGRYIHSSITTLAYSINVGIDVISHKPYGVMSGEAVVTPAFTTESYSE